MSSMPGSAPPGTIALLDIEAGRFRYSAFRNMTIGIWSDQATVEYARRVLRISKQMAQNYPSGHSSVVFVLDGAPAPTPEATEVFSRMYDDKVSRLSCLAIVVEGGGFWASSIRSSITKIRMAVPGPMQLQVSTTIEQVVEWLPSEHTRRTGIMVSASELRTVLTGCRQIGTSEA